MLCGLDAASGTPPPATDGERSRLVPGKAASVHETFLKTSLEIPGQPHVTSLACELAIKPPRENITALWAVHHPRFPSLDNDLGVQRRREAPSVCNALLSSLVASVTFISCILP